jgi:hypothetical protein
VNKCKSRGHSRRVRAISNKEEPGIRAMAPPGYRSLYCGETHSSGATRRENWLLTAPVRIEVGRDVVDDLVLTLPVWFDRVDLTVGSCVVDKGYALT